MLFACALALELGKTVEEIGQMRLSEFRNWQAYFAWREEARKAERAAQNRQADAVDITRGNFRGFR